MSEKPCYVYALLLQREDLANWAQELGSDIAHWVADPSQFSMGKGLPEDWKERGALFAEKGELRWWRDGDAYRALLLTDHEVPGLHPLPGSWSREERSVRFFLQPLDAPHVRPNFESYPHGGERGQLEAVIFRCDGVAMFVSPRRLLP
ncbi:MAG TPA: hypothetical protein VNL15_06370 [Dehalococcoidia bacterium]|nr:hypothetical protein [Dehalococcoidia bacterium]